MKKNKKNKEGNIIMLCIEIELKDGSIKKFDDIKSYKEVVHDWEHNTSFDPECVTCGYFVASSGEISYSYLPDFCTNLSKFGNMSSDKEYMKRRAREIKLYNLLSNFAEVVNEGWEPNWDDEHEYKYYYYFESFKCIHKVGCTRIWKSLNEVYFKSEELVKRAIDEIILPFENNLL